MTELPLLDHKVKELCNILLEADLDDSIESGAYSEKISDFIGKVAQVIPEWKELIGKKQHVTHDYTLDVHTLLTLKRVKESEFLNNLNHEQKLILLYTALLHDIEKIEKAVDPEHPVRGAEKASDILFRLGFNEEFINDVFVLIKNHQVLGLMAANRMEMNLDKIISLLHKPELVDLLIILTIADIKSVKANEMFFCETVKENIEKLKNELELKFDKSAH